LKHDVEWDYSRDLATRLVPVGKFKLVAMKKSAIRCVVVALYYFRFVAAGNLKASAPSCKLPALTPSDDLGQNHALSVSGTFPMTRKPECVCIEATPDDEFAAGGLSRRRVVPGSVKSHLKQRICQPACAFFDLHF